MEPTLLRCESRRQGGMGLGLWRYSLGVLIVAAAMLDALVFVPAQPRREARERVPQISTELHPCRPAPPSMRPADPAPIP